MTLDYDVNLDILAASQQEIPVYCMILVVLVVVQWHISNFAV